MSVLVSGAGPWPGVAQLEAQSAVIGEIAGAPEPAVGMPWVVRLPERGPEHSAVGAGLGLLVDMPAEIGPHGWRLADRPGHDAARLDSARRETVEALAVAAHGWSGPLAMPVCGPLTLAASTYLARGDRAVADRGAVTEIVQSLSAGIVDQLAAITRTLPEVEPTVLLHEPLLDAVVAGTLPTFSGYARLRAIPSAEVAELLGDMVRTLRAGGARRVVVHLDAGAGLAEVVRRAGADGLGVRVSTLDERRWEQVAEAVEDGVALWAQVEPPQTSQCAGPDVRGVAEPVLAGWRRVGLPVAQLRELAVVAPAARTGAPDSVQRARATLATVTRAAGLIAERAED
ncbi:hypothetical protein [Cellulomonas sp. NPDC089187]|uniref:hypothetical protein n=1 Tax=Cellulomonas sp. NPDC089187 TaxID=3154970 RepID=UPI003440311D